MGPVTAFSMYLIVWWVVFLTVLPHGSQNYHQAGKEPPPGVDPGVPVNANMKKKLLVTTLVSVGVWLVLYLIAQFDFVPLTETMRTY